MKPLRTLSMLALICGLLSLSLEARVVRLEVLSRAPLAVGAHENSGSPAATLPAYEKIKARVYFAVRPEDVHNQAVVDVDKAPRNAQGEVEFSADLFLLKPLTKGNDALLLEIPNRGGKGLVNLIDGGKSDPTEEADLGDAWLLKQGFTLAALGWQWDVVPEPGSLRLYAPVAYDYAVDGTGSRSVSSKGVTGESITGKSITGLLRDDFTPSAAASDWQLGHAMGTRLGGVEYPAAAPEDSRNVLTVRATPHGERTLIPRSKWSFTREVGNKLIASDRYIHLNSGFQAGMIYELIYVVRDPVVAGLGFAAVRDFVAWMKHSPEAVAPVKFVYAAGISQCGRFLRDFLYQGFNADESDRMVLDGVLAHVGGAGRGSFNYRFAQPSRDGQPMSSIDYPTDIFPFTDLPESDPDHAADGQHGLLDLARAKHVEPKVFFSHTSYEYWGRAASLIHTTADGKADAPIGDNVRIYFYSGLQHFSVAFPPEIGSGDRASQQLPSPLPIRWFWRAMIANMDAWVRSSIAPPPSRYPKISDGTLVAINRVAFPRIPGFLLPATANQGWELDFGPHWRGGILSRQPPAAIRPYPTLVPQVDADGNDLGGIRLPEITVPLATYTGWNLRSPAIGAPSERTAFLGSFVPFPSEAVQPLGVPDHRYSPSLDSRVPISERYKGYAEYRERFAAALDGLIGERYVLSVDRGSVLARSQPEWDWILKYRVPQP